MTMDRPQIVGPVGRCGFSSCFDEQIGDCVELPGFDLSDVEDASRAAVEPLVGSPACTTRVMF